MQYIPEPGPWWNDDACQEWPYSRSETGSRAPRCAAGPENLSPVPFDVRQRVAAQIAPQATMAGERLLSDPAEIAAAYVFYLCRNHPFVDGNKRVALATCLVFLSESDLLPGERLDVDAWEALTLDVAASRLDRAQITTRLQQILASST